jgi:hypothetical protein
LVHPLSFPGVGLRRTNVENPEVIMTAKKASPELGMEFRLLARQVSQLHAEWLIYKQIFDEANLPLLNETLPSVLSIFQSTLRTSIFMSFVRLTDVEDDLTLKHLLLKVKDHCPVAFFDEQTKKLNDIEAMVAPIKRIRNRTLGHNDLKTLSNEDLLPKVTRDQIDQAAEAIAEWVNDISLEMTGQNDYYLFQHPVLVGDGKDLIHYIQRASASFDEEDRRRLGR